MTKADPVVTSPDLLSSAAVVADESFSATPIRGLIFDFDGLIVDTETAIYQAWKELYDEHQLPLTIEVWAQCIGSDFGHYDPAADLERLTGLTFDWTSLTQRRRERVNSLLSSQDTLPGIRELLQHAQAVGMPCAVASSSSLNWVGGWINRLGLMPYFKNITTLDDVGRAKPDPGLFLHAAEKLELQPSEILVLEDSLNGLRAATAAGMRCMVVPGMLTRHLDFTGAWRQIESLAEFDLCNLGR